MGTWTKRGRSAVGPVAVLVSLLVGLPVLTDCKKSDGTAPDTTRPRRAPRPTTTVPATTPKNPLIIGLVTGKLDPLVRQGMENSARLAVRHANDDNRTPDWRIELVIVEDTRPEAAAKAVRKLALRKEVAAIVGPGDVETVAKVAGRSLPVALVSITESSPRPPSEQAFLEDYEASEATDAPGPLGPATYEAVTDLINDIGPSIRGNALDRPTIISRVAQRLAAEVAATSTTSTSSTIPDTNVPNSA